MDPRFKVEVISQTPTPQRIIYAGMHQDYAEGFVYDEMDQIPDEAKAGELIVKYLLQGNRGHYGPFEHPQLVLNFGYFPHSVMQQVRTHRNVSFDVQCLAADTKITFVNAKGHANRTIKKTIGEIYELWAHGETAIRQRFVKGRNGEPPGEYRRDCKKRLQKMRLRVLNEETGRFEIGQIKEVMCSGLQPVYRLTLADGKTLDCTANHRLYTTSGWQTMGDAVGLVADENGAVVNLTKSCEVLCNGIVAAGNGLYRDKLWLQSQLTLGKSAEDIATLCNCSPTSVRGWAKKYSLSFLTVDTCFYKGQKPWNYKPEALYRSQDWLEARLTEGLHVDEMAKLANCSIECIKKWVYAYGLTLNKRPSGTKNPWNKGKGGYQLRLTEESRQKRLENAYKYTRRGSASNFWKGGTAPDRMLIGAWTRQIAPQVHRKFNYVCQKCGTRGGELHAHHLIPVFADVLLAYEFDNLVSVCKPCHEHIHHHHLELEFAQTYQQIFPSPEWNPKSNTLVAHPVQVVNVEYLGVQTTYDIEVEGPWHNFIANGMVVHNSFRYTGQRILEVLEGKEDLEDVFYLRPVGSYSDRQGKKYEYTLEQRQEDLEWCLMGCKRYAERIHQGLAEEHARGLIPFDVRQHWVMSGNARAIMHLLDIRGKFDVQPETRVMTELMFEKFQLWMPEVAAWYEKTRWRKGTLAP
jgi:thymidylate synthase (FAD)